MSKNKTIVIRDFKDSVIDEFTYLGIMNLNKEKFKVYNFFRKTKAAILYHGNSRIIFISNNGPTAYNLKSNENLLDSISGNKAYSHGKFVTINELSKILCLSDG